MYFNVTLNHTVFVKALLLQKKITHTHIKIMLSLYDKKDFEIREWVDYLIFKNW